MFEEKAWDPRAFCERSVMAGQGNPRGGCLTSNVIFWKPETSSFSLEVQSSIPVSRLFSRLGNFSLLNVNFSLSKIYFVIVLNPTL